MPNALDVAQLDRPKLDGARFHLGLVGIVPSRKRLDLALDVLEELRRDDDRYLLFVKSGMPWEHWWVWQNPAEREHYANALRRVQRSPLLRGAVVFDDAGPDVAAWLRRIGFVLSTSDDESFHVAPAEGMASRAVPVLRHWPGAETIYDMRWIHRGPAEMAAAVMALGNEGDWRAAGDDAHGQARRIRPAAGVRGLAAPAHRGPGPGGAWPDSRTARFPLSRVYFTLAISAATPPEVCCAGRRGPGHRPAVHADPRPGTGRLARARHGRAAVLHWGRAGTPRNPRLSHAGTIWPPGGRGSAPGAHGPAGPASIRSTWPEVPGAVVICDRALWAADSPTASTTTTPADLRLPHPRLPPRCGDPVPSR